MPVDPERDSDDDGKAELRRRERGGGCPESAVWSEHERHREATLRPRFAFVGERLAKRVRG